MCVLRAPHGHGAPLRWCPVCARAEPVQALLCDSPLGFWPCQISLRCHTHTHICETVRGCILVSDPHVAEGSVVVPDHARARRESSAAGDQHDPSLIRRERKRRATNHIILAVPPGHRRPLSLSHRRACGRAAVPKVDGVTAAPTTIPKRLGAGMECWVESFPWNDDERIAIFEPVRRGWELRRKGNLARVDPPRRILTQAVGRDKF